MTDLLEPLVTEPSTPRSTDLEIVDTGDSGIGGDPRRWWLWLTVAVCGLVLVSSVGGLLDSATYLDFTTSLHMAESQGQDVVSLVVALPLIGLAVRRARRGEWGGRAIWVGGLAYVAYVQMLYAFGGVYSTFFLLYVATLGMSLFVIGSIGLDAFRSAPGAGDSIPRTAVAGFLAATSAVLGLIWIAMAMQGIADAEAVDANAIIVTDLIAVFPISILVALGLRSGRSWAPFAAAALLAFDVVLGTSILAGQFVAYFRGIDPAWTLGFVFIPFTIVARRLMRPSVWALDHTEPWVRKPHRRRWPWALGVVVLLVGGGYVAFQALTGVGTDYGDMTWTDSFDAVHEELAENYPFTEHKQLDWNAAYAETAPRIAAAEAAGDQGAYELALREYVHGIPDGHVGFSGDDGSLRDLAVGGGYGFGIIELDDGRVIAHVIDPEGPAEIAGVSWGDEITAWNGVTIDEALTDAPIVWSDAIAATSEARHAQQLLYLVRGPVGGTATIDFLDAAGEERSLTLTAVEDGYETLNASGVHAADDMGVADAMVAMVHEELVTGEILESGYGYIDVDGFLFTARQPRVAAAFRWIMHDFIADDVPGVIIDLRGNQGGLDAAAASMASHFVSETVFFQDLAEMEDGQLVIDTEQRQYVEPSSVSFDGPVVALIDGHAMSAAEGLPMIIQQLPQGTIVGMEGTGASFAAGDLTDVFHMPGGYIINYLPQASMDANGAIQVDSDAIGDGGITPDVRVPLSEANVRSVFVDGVDVVLQTAIDHLDSQSR